MPNFRQIQLLGFRHFLLQIKRFGIFHGRLLLVFVHLLDGFVPRGFARRTAKRRAPVSRDAASAAGFPLSFPV